MYWIFEEGWLTANRLTPLPCIERISTWHGHILQIIRMVKHFQPTQRLRCAQHPYIYREVPQKKKRNYTIAVFHSQDAWDPLAPINSVGQLLLKQWGLGESSCQGFLHSSKPCECLNPPPCVLAFDPTHFGASLRVKAISGKFYPWKGHWKAGFNFPPVLIGMENALNLVYVIRNRMSRTTSSWWAIQLRKIFPVNMAFDSLRTSNQLLPYPLGGVTCSLLNYILFHNRLVKHLLLILVIILLVMDRSPKNRLNTYICTLVAKISAQQAHLMVCCR